jgi:integrase
MYARRRVSSRSREAGVPHLGVHAMRHWAATFALDEGIALAVV